ncbi:DMBT1 [Acanthosepion pharaonis]|uniref:DMBT1 n=1 Tax=Acanthosepion pharaonis TaxID=158019 RepID=A0A812BDY0_ACAPH|nr:DMBT1 [Sepia pharaonis]
MFGLLVAASFLGHPAGVRCRVADFTPFLITSFHSLVPLPVISSSTTPVSVSDYYNRFGGTAQGSANYGSGTGVIWLDEVNCLGNEISIDQCEKNEWGEHNCVHSEDAGVNCTISITQIFTSPRVHTTQQIESTRVSTTPSTSMHDSVIIQLVGSNDGSAGRVEIFYQEQWGTVCDDQWDNNDARVICRMLGFSDGTSTVGGSYGPGNGSIWLDEVKCSGNEQSITECTSSPWGSTDCKHSEDAGVKCGITSATPSNPLSIRLVGGNTTSSGRVEINYNNKWGTVCHDKWDDNDARVVCHMLGYSHGIAFNAAKYGMGSGDIWLDEVNCTGSENSIADCPKNSWGVHDCHHGEDAGVDCSTNEIPVRIRLVGGENASSGRVELNLNGEWGTICDDGWDNNDALVICRMLGYVDGIGLSYGWYGAGTGKIFLDEVNCVGNETNIIYCKKQAWESSNCDHGEDASVQCFSQKAMTVAPSIASDVSVRLAGGNSLSRGRVEIHYNGQWGTICDDSWDDRDAQVVCKMLGYVDGSASRTFQAGTGPIWLDQVECQGSEASIEQCVRNRWGIHDCSHSEDAGVECSMTTRIFTTTPSNRGAQGIQQARLIGGNNFTVGRLEVMINNVWGTVCDDNWDDRDATVACRMLGFSSGIGYRNARFGSGTGQIWLDELNCTGTEISLSQCVSSNAGVHDCSHLEDASMQCFRREATEPTIGTASIRLIGGQNTNEGRVEIYHQGQWGTICNNNWDMKEIIVACRMLGFKKGNMLNRIIPGIGIIWLSNVDCSGSEISLEQCSKSDWGVHDCQHEQDVAIICQ